MSHHSEDNFTSACSDSFWEPGNYKRTTKRIEDGNKLCGDLMSLVSERAEIEKNYAKQLKAWASKWNNIIEKGKLQPHGIIQAGFFSLGQKNSVCLRKNPTIVAKKRYFCEVEFRESVFNGATFTYKYALLQKKIR